MHARPARSKVPEARCCAHWSQASLWRKLPPVVDPEFVRVVFPRSESTCFSVPGETAMPSAEAVASALLQLKNNARLFEKWRELRGYPFKANGKMFRDPYQLTRDET